jgi:hypothetical protein
VVARSCLGRALKLAGQKRDLLDRGGQTPRRSCDCWRAATAAWLAAPLASSAAAAIWLTPAEPGRRPRGWPRRLGDLVGAHAQRLGLLHDSAQALLDSAVAVDLQLRDGHGLVDLAADLADLDR